MSPPAESSVAYFSMELGLDPSIPTYAGGLGVLAGDTLRAAADRSLPLVAVSLVHRKGHFRQQLDARGWQTEEPESWDPEERCEELPARVRLEVEGRTVTVRAFRYWVRGNCGGEVPIHFLDTRLPENSEADRALTDSLYGGDKRYRLSQELVLGVGGVAMLEALGYSNVKCFHMNEGHSALLALALLERESGDLNEAIASVRKRCVFTTHTPVPAGHDQFSYELMEQVLGTKRTERLLGVPGCVNGCLNMTQLALYFAHYVNGVAMRHGQISKSMFPSYPVASITNGVHAETWAAEPFCAVFDQHIPDWRRQNENLRYAVGIPLHEIRSAHAQCKAALLAEVADRTNQRLSEQVLTIGFARRVTPYKRAELLLADLDRLRAISRKTPLQILYAGKAHPDDIAGKEIIQRVVGKARELVDTVPVVYLQGYDMASAKRLCSGVDLWLNTPQKPQEASGTSGMKAALNGVPSLSVLDGWWIEGHVEDVTGWAIGEGWEPEPDIHREADQLYQKLEHIAARFYGKPDSYGEVMRHAIALNGSFFNAQRMIEQYAESAYQLKQS
jgi:starch phosphorylase